MPSNLFSATDAARTHHAEGPEDSQFFRISKAFSDPLDAEAAKYIEIRVFDIFVEKYGRNWRADFVDRIRQEGIEQGIERGIEQGKRETLAHLIRVRFSLNVLPDTLARRLEAATLEEAIPAEARIFSAERPEDVLPSE